MEYLIQYEWVLALILLLWICLLPLSFVNFLINTGRFIWHFSLFLFAWLLIPVLTLINYALVRSKGYFLSTALSLDIWGNREFRTLWNTIFLKTGEGYPFGFIGETMSSALGKNERMSIITYYKFLKFKSRRFVVTPKTRFAIFINRVLHLTDRNHCFKSINDNIGPKS